MSNQSAATNHKLFEISETVNHESYKILGCLISEPKKYLGTHLLLFFGLLLYYIFTASRSPPVLIAITVILHIITIVVLIILAYTDPGMLPKILVTYEKK